MGGVDTTCRVHKVNTKGRVAIKFRAFFVFCFAPITLHEWVILVKKPHIEEGYWHALLAGRKQTRRWGGEGRWGQVNYSESVNCRPALVGDVKALVEVLYHLRYMSC
jgi:hypothetical protein